MPPKPPELKTAMTSPGRVVSRMRETMAGTSGSAKTGRPFAVSSVASLAGSSASPGWNRSGRSIVGKVLGKVSD